MSEHATTGHGVSHATSEAHAHDPHDHIHPEPTNPLFKYVFSTPTPQLKEQSAMLADELARDAASTATASTSKGSGK